MYANICMHIIGCVYMSLCVRRVIAGVYVCLYQCVCVSERSVWRVDGYKEKEREMHKF